VGTSIWLNGYHPLYFLNSSLTQIRKINQRDLRTKYILKGLFK